MKTKSQNETGLRELFVDQLKDILWAERAIVKALPDIVDKASSQELINALNEHREESMQQITRLENVFDLIKVKVDDEKCEAMKGILDEADDITDSLEEGPVRDAGIIAACQKIEHYEIATYGSLKSFANQIGEFEVSSILEETLAEEKDADKKLTEIAESVINMEAAGQHGEHGSYTRPGSSQF